MAQRRWLIASGGILLVGMLMCAAFSLGIYVGRFGPSAQGLRYSLQPGAAPQAAGPQQPDVTGLLRRRLDHTLELATRQGPRQVEVTPETTIGNDTGSHLALEELRPGDLLAVFGRLVPGDGRQFQAERVIRLTSVPGGQP